MLQHIAQTKQEQLASPEAQRFSLAVDAHGNLGRPGMATCRQGLRDSAGTEPGSCETRLAGIACIGRNIHGRLVGRKSLEMKLLKTGARNRPFG